MFEQTFIEQHHATKKPVTLAVSLLLEAAVVCLLTIIPLLYTQNVPPAVFKNLLVAPVPPRQAAEPPTTKAVQRLAPRTLQILQFFAPIAIPKKPLSTDQIAAAPDIGTTGGASDLNLAGDLGIIGVLGSPSDAAAAPPEIPQPKKPPASEPIRVGSISEANLVRKVLPVYPPLAKSARIQGAVEFTALISKDGRIENLQLVHGHPLLVNAAREAVEQWKYRPTLLNGVPVEVITDIIVNFTLNQ